MNKKAQERRNKQEATGVADTPNEELVEALDPLAGDFGAAERDCCSYEGCKKEKGCV